MKYLFSSLLASSLTLSAAAQLPKLSSDFREVANRADFFKKVPLTPAHKALLRQNHFVQSPTPDLALYFVYGSNQYEHIPSLITADNALQVYHIFFDSTLRLVEEKSLLPELEKMTSALIVQGNSRVAQVKGTPLESAALKNLAYYTVAAKLLKADTPVAPEVEAMVTAELAKIDQHGGFESSSIFPYKMDFSQFVIRGHYSRSADLGRYFKAMMWFGLVPISVAKRENQAVTLLPEQIRQASLISLDLAQANVIPQWKRIYDVSSLYAGKSNRLTPFEWEALMRAKLPTGVDPIKALAEPRNLEVLARAALSARPPAIVTKKDDAVVAGNAQVRFMGQREIPDSVIFNRLTDPYVRPFPSPLDVASVLGNARATQLLDSYPALARSAKWPAYKATRNALATEFQSKPAATWSQDLYWSWLDSLKIASQTPVKGTPSVFRSTAWQDHRLNSILASWAELRHDTILYGEQTVSEMGDGDEPPDVKGYVEPALALYRRMQAQLDQTESGLKSFGALSEEQATAFKDFREFLKFLDIVSLRELAGQKLSKEQYNRIQYIEGEMEGLNTSIQIIGQNFRQLNQDDLNMALIADVHTAEGRALTVAVGLADDLIAIVPIEGKLTLVKGSALSYYEFLQPISDRLTDEKWKAMLAAGKAPARPTWTKSFFVNKPARPKDQ